MGLVKETVLNGYLFEIVEEDIVLSLKSYSFENSSFVLYISNGDSVFEKEFKNYIESYNLVDKIIFLNGWNKLNSNFAVKFKKEMFDSRIQDISVDALQQANLYYFENGKIVSLLYKDKQKISMLDVKNYLESIGDVIDD